MAPYLGERPTDGEPLLAPHHQALRPAQRGNLARRVRASWNLRAAAKSLQKFAPGFDVARRRAPGDTVARRKSPRGLRQALNQKSVQFGQFRRAFRLAGRLPRAT